MHTQLPKPQPPPTSILVIRLSSLGDVILTTPVVRQLQRTYPEAIIDVVVNEKFAEVYANSPRVRRIWHGNPSTTLDSDMDAWKLEMKESVPNGYYDLVVDLQGNVSSATIRHGLGRTAVVYPKFRMQKLAMVWLKRFPAITTHVVERYRHALSSFPLVMDTEAPEVWLPEEKQTGVYSPGHRSLLTHGAHNGHRTERSLQIAIAPGSQHGTKRWPAIRYAQLCSELARQGATVHLIGGQADTELCTTIESIANVTMVRHDGASSLYSTISVLDRADVLVTNDSGVMHLGAARRIPIVAIFGSSVTHLGFTPYGVPHIIVERDVACRPCSHIGRAECPKKHFRCMVETEPEHVVQAILKLLSRSSIG